MKSITTIMLSFALSAVIICGLILYGKYADAKDDLAISEKTLSDSNEKNNQLNEETTPLHDKIEKNAEGFRELKNAEERAEELENTISVKNQGPSSFDEKLDDLEKQFEEEKKRETALEVELSYRKAEVAKFLGRLETSQSRILDIEDRIARLRIEVEDLRDNLSDLEEEIKRGEVAAGPRDKARHMLRARINDAKLDFKSAQRKLRDLRKELRDENMLKVGIEDELSYHNAQLAKLLGRLEISHSRILYLTGQLKASETVAQEKTDEETPTETAGKKETHEEAEAYEEPSKEE